MEITDQARAQMVQETLEHSWLNLRSRNAKAHPFLHDVKFAEMLFSNPQFKENHENGWAIQFFDDKVKHTRSVALLVAEYGMAAEGLPKEFLKDPEIMSIAIAATPDARQFSKVPADKMVEYQTSKNNNLIYAGRVGAEQKGMALGGD